MDIDTLISKGIAYGLIDRDDLVGYSEVELENLRQCQGVEKIPDQFQDFLKRMGKSNSKIIDLLFMNIYTYEEVKSVFLREKYDPLTMDLFPVRDSFVFLYVPDGLVFFLLSRKKNLKFMSMNLESICYVRMTQVFLIFLTATWNRIAKNNREP